MTRFRFRWDVIWDNLGFLLQGAILTLAISSIAILLGLMLGAVAAVMRSSNIRPLRIIATAYVEIIRATPLIVQLYIIFFVLPAIFIRLDSLQAGIVGLTIYSGAYLSEILRAGLESVTRGQKLAATALGLSSWQTFRYITLPQALARIMPPLSNQFIDTTLSSSVAAVIGMTELTLHGLLLDSRTFRPFESYAAVGVIYLLITIFLTFVFTRLTSLVGASRGVTGTSMDLSVSMKIQEKAVDDPK